MTIENDWMNNNNVRRRYYWALRTFLICESSKIGAPKFSSNSLEEISGVQGLAVHIDSRLSVSFDECCRIGGTILDKFGGGLKSDLQGIRLREYLTALGGIARDSVRVVEEREAVEAGALQIYN